MSKLKTDSARYVGPDGEARELDADFFREAKRGRPPVPEPERKRRVNITLDPDVARAAKEAGGNLSERINRLLRRDLGL
ncbi:MAG TPA: BrnA antitoxin family protein [Paracoccaceae bacterium]|nr:BrnA antitoxin family protein [Paracoccaceae bacterium]